MTSLWTVCSRGRYRALGVTILALVVARARRRPRPRPPRSRRRPPGTRRLLPPPPAPAPPSAGAPSPSGRRPRAARPAAASGDSGAYTVRLRGLERNVNELKEQVFRTKARLNLLKETVLGGVIGASRAWSATRTRWAARSGWSKRSTPWTACRFRQGRRYRPAGRMNEFDIYNGAIQPGSHTSRCT